MLLTEDGHLDIERVKQLNEEQLNEEMESWGPAQLGEWLGEGKFVTLDEFFEKYRQKIREAYAHNKTNK